MLYSAYKKTDNIYTSIVGDKISTNICENKNSDHMLNTHYIDNFKIDFPNSRLNTYINHKSE